MTKEESSSAVFKMDNQQNLLYSIGNSAQSYVAAWMVGEFGGVGGGGMVHIYGLLSPFTVRLKLS